MSFSWLDFFLFFLWINCIGFFISYTNFINLLFFCEIFWILYFIYFSILSYYYNSIIFFLIAIYLLCIATSETTIGFSILILKSIIFGSINNLNLISRKDINSFNKLKVGLINSKVLKKWGRI